METTDTLLTLAEVADRLRVSTRTVKRILSRGELPSVRLTSGPGPTVRIREKDLNTYIEGRLRRGAATA